MLKGGLKVAAKKKFKRDYIILEAKDTNFRYKERVLPKAFAKVEINDEKSIISLYVENLKFMKDGYRVVAIQSDYDTLDLGKVLPSEQGKGEFTLNLDREDIDIKGIALLYEKTVPLIGFKGTKIDNYEEILFAGEEYEDDERFEEYEEIEYIEVDDNDEGFEEYEEIGYIDVDNIEEDDNEEEYEVYEEIEYIEIDDDEEEYESEEESVYNSDDGYYEIIEEDVNPQTREKYDEYDNIDKTIEKNRKSSEPKENKTYPNASHQQKTRQKYAKSNSIDEYQKTAGTLLMPRQIKKGLKHFKEVKPFIKDEIDNTRWWKIEISPTTLCGYTMPYLGYVNTLNYTMYSDAVMQSYKYRHYLFGVQYDEYNKRKNYIYAVPGNKTEQPDKGHTGFREYQPCDTRNDSLGYWLCMIDSRSRKIIK